VILKSNTVTFFKIVSGLQNNLQNYRRPPECRNKYFEEGYGKDLVSVFIEASQIFILYFLHNKAPKKILILGFYTESSDLIFKAFKNIIHLVTQSL